MHYYIIKYRALDGHGGHQHARFRADSVIAAALCLMESRSVKEKDILEVVWERRVSG